MKHIIEWAHAFTDENSTSSMKNVSAWDMVFSRNNNQRRGQHRAVKTKSNSRATRRHKVSLVASQHRPGGNLNYVPGALSSCKLDKVVIVTPTVPASLLRLHASLAVRNSVFLHREHYDKCFGDDLLGNVKGFILFVSICWWVCTLYFTHHFLCVCVYNTCIYCHLVTEYSTVIFLPFPRHLHTAPAFCTLPFKAAPPSTTRRVTLSWTHHQIPTVGSLSTF